MWRTWRRRREICYFFNFFFLLSRPARQRLLFLFDVNQVKRSLTHNIRLKLFQIFRLHLHKLWIFQFPLGVSKRKFTSVITTLLCTFGANFIRFWPSADFISNFKWIKAPKLPSARGHVINQLFTVVLIGISRRKLTSSHKTLWCTFSANFIYIRRFVEFLSIFLSIWVVWFQPSHPTKKIDN